MLSKPLMELLEVWELCSSKYSSSNGKMIWLWEAFSLLSLITFPMSTLTDWLSKWHIANICCGPDILVIWPCGPEGLQGFLKPHITDSDSDSLSECPFHRKRTCKIYLLRSPHMDCHLNTAFNHPCHGKRSCS